VNAREIVRVAKRAAIHAVREARSCRQSQLALFV
jgi:hypothetical protein